MYNTMKYCYLYCTVHPTDENGPSLAADRCSVARFVGRHSPVVDQRSSYRYHGDIDGSDHLLGNRAALVSADTLTAVGSHYDDIGVVVVDVLRDCAVCGPAENRCLRLYALFITGLLHSFDRIRTEPFGLGDHLGYPPATLSIGPLLTTNSPWTRPSHCWARHMTCSIAMSDKGARPSGPVFLYTCISIFRATPSPKSICQTA